MAGTSEDTSTYQLILRGVDRVGGSMVQADFDIPYGLLPARWPQWNVSQDAVYVDAPAAVSLGIHLNIPGSGANNFGSSSAAGGASTQFGPMIGVASAAVNTVAYSNPMTVTVPNPSGQRITVSLINLTAIPYGLYAGVPTENGWVIALRFTPVTRTL